MLTGNSLGGLLLVDPLCSPASLGNFKYFNCRSTYGAKGILSYVFGPGSLEPGPTRSALGDSHLPAVGVNNLLDDPQVKISPVSVGRVPWLEDSPMLGLGGTRARIRRVEPAVHRTNVDNHDITAVFDSVAVEVLS